MKTMKLIITLFTFVLITSSRCRKEGKDCHYSVKIQNNSEKKMLWGIVSAGIKGCKISSSEIESKSTDKYNPYSTCIEDRLTHKNDSNIIVYFLDPQSTFSPDEFYNCDSVENKYTILKKCAYTLNDLKNSDFTISYP